MFDLGALWMPIKYEIPMLILMYNNRAYYNDWAHQIHMAHQRGTDPARAYIGMDLEAPPPDFAHVAKGIGWYAEGPIEDPAEGSGVKAHREVKAGKPAVVDAIVWRRGENARGNKINHEGHKEPPEVKMMCPNLRVLRVLVVRFEQTQGGHLLADSKIKKSDRRCNRHHRRLIKR